MATSKWSSTRRPVTPERRARIDAVKEAMDQEERRERLRAEFIAGAEADSRRRVGRGLTAEELGRVLRRYPGD